MIVYDGGDAWQLVLQPHHGDLSGELAAAWGNDEFAAPKRRQSLFVAATRHDDGWSVSERWPKLAAGDGRPLPFYESPHVPSHLDFYRAAITDISGHDPYAGLLVSMHGAGLYRGRYGMHPGLRSAWNDEFREEIEPFVAEIEGSYPRRMAEAGVSDEQRWTDYRLLQVFDHLSLYFSGLFRVELGEVHGVTSTPVDYEGTETELEIVPVSPFEPFTPRHVTMNPFPFAESPVRFTLERRVLPKRSWSSEEFRQAFYSTPTETVDILVERT